MCRMTRSIIDNRQNPEWKVLSSAIFFYLGYETIHEPVFRMGYCDPSLGI
jgi:hypothetical protein